MKEWVKLDIGEESMKRLAMIAKNSIDFGQKFCEDPISFCESKSFKVYNGYTTNKEQGKTYALVHKMGNNVGIIWLFLDNIVPIVIEEDIFNEEWIIGLDFSHIDKEIFMIWFNDNIRAIQESCKKYLLTMPKDAREMEVELKNLSNQANAYLLDKQYDKAISCSTEIIEKNGEYPLGYIFLGMAYYEKNDFEKAIEKLTKGINLAERFMDQNHPTLSDAYTFRADAYFKTGKHKRAIEDYNKAIDLGTKNIYAYIGIASIYSEKGEYDKSIEFNSKAIALDPKCVEAYCNRGYAYMRKKNNDNAKEDFQKAIEINPNLIQIYVDSGMNCYDKFEYDNAIEYFNKAISIDKECVDAYIGRGYAYLENEKYKEAKDDFKEAKHLGSTKAYERLGKVFYKKNDIPSAIENFTLAIKDDPNNSRFFINRGLAHFMNKDFNNAIKDYDLALKNDPNFAQAYLHRSTAYYEKGKSDAIKDCEKALSIKPDYSEAKEFFLFLNGIIL